MERLPPPDRVLVYNFAVTPQEVQLDAVGSAITKTFDGTADLQQEQQVGHAVADALAKHLVQQIQNMGLYAERAAGPVPPTGIDVLILGQLVSIDEGNAAERMVIGLGAGRSDVEAHVQVYESAAGRRSPSRPCRDSQEQPDAGRGGDDGRRGLDRASAGFGGDHRRLAGRQPDTERQRRLGSRAARRQGRRSTQGAVRDAGLDRRGELRSCPRHGPGKGGLRTARFTAGSTAMLYLAPRIVCCFRMCGGEGDDKQRACAGRIHDRSRPHANPPKTPCPTGAVHTGRSAFSTTQRAIMR